jgi:glycosyltransferase involved in cell wall biosynthesis
MKQSVAPQQETGGALPVVVWDGLGLAAEYSGIGVYGAKLFEALCELGCQPYVASFEGATPSFVPKSQQITLDRSKTKIARRFEALKPIHPIATYRASTERWADLGLIFHGLSNINLPLLLRKRRIDRFVVTIHDLIPLNLDELTPLGIQMRMILPWLIARADRIITPSYWTKLQILEHFGAHLSERIDNLGNGLSPPPRVTKVWSERTIDGLTVSRGECYKRLEMVASMARNMPAKRFTVITDARGKKILGQGLANVTVLENVSPADLGDIYQNSKVLIHPSLYEGWCFPAAEAVSRGLSMVFCRGSGIDEVASSAKKQVIGLNAEAKIDDWTSAFASLLDKDRSSGELPKLQTWSEVAQKTLKIYQSLL